MEVREGVRIAFLVFGKPRASHCVRRRRRVKSTYAVGGLEEELEAVEGPGIITLGAPALRGVTANAFKGASLSSLRHKTLEAAGRMLIPTIHPSSLLRLKHEAARAREMRRLETDLARAFSASGEPALTRQR